jgi:hypothetical protein
MHEQTGISAFTTLERLGLKVIETVGCIVTKIARITIDD